MGVGVGMQLEVRGPNSWRGIVGHDLVRFVKETLGGLVVGAGQSEYGFVLN